MDTQNLILPGRNGAHGEAKAEGPSLHRQPGLAWAKCKGLASEKKDHFSTPSKFPSHNDKKPGGSARL